MGWSITYLPGDANEPCTDEQCGHTDCAAARDAVVWPCTICGRPIGYNTRYYGRQSEGMQHALCLELQIERDQLLRPPGSP